MTLDTTERALMLAVLVIVLLALFTAAMTIVQGVRGRSGTISGANGGTITIQNPRCAPAVPAEEEDD